MVSSIDAFVDLSESITNAEGEAWIGVTASTSTDYSIDYVSDFRMYELSFGNVVTDASSSKIVEDGQVVSTSTKDG